ncbi:dihydropyrimidinase [Bosea sp. (in: a-proteobacteria)]|uniref:dihydropyrimidinase n=1 Tax=Bosea sp. (in: a-proteobacteria) TaxID=1871050 RepID=UPI0012274F51|nr:dihydropyrimidinase [Bosea sp. (in: a-proteobacteria)]TAJ27501.1 MAG: dihydropyrimidinase [Bosea sp. (in: a-proteobacteria)]
MTTTPYDLLIRGGTIGSATGSFVADLAVKDGKVAALGLGLGPAAREIDATGKLVLPGGVDTHAHVEQVSAGGLLNADSFESATASAAFGGTTTLISFAAQHRGLDLRKVVDDYSALARRGAMIDYAFHLIVANPDRKTLETDLPALIAEGHASIKVFMTYDLIKVDDEPLLDLLLSARENGALVCVHAENHGMIAWMARRLVEKGYVAPRYHGVSHPRLSEAEAFNRLIAASELLDQPVMIFHVSTREGVRAVREARGRGLKIFAETCPQYLFLTREDLDKPGLEGGKWMCSPPPRETDDQEALWQGLALGDLQTVSSDHAPYRFDETGKLSAGPNPNFKQIANGLPGLETRLPLLFDAMVSQARPEFAGRGLDAFVQLTATAPAQIYNLPGKGALLPGYDADLAIWDPCREVTLSDAMMHDRTGFTPFAGRRITGWPETVLLRGREVVADGAVKASPGSGRWLARRGGWAARPTGRLVAEMDPARNFGAELL